MLKDVLDSLRAIRRPLGRPRRWPGKLHADQGYDYWACRELVRRRGMISRIARKASNPALTSAGTDKSSSGAWNG
ncbi:hypothetical protein [Nonomuraea sp. B19D2]|uniref:hypothetical protein n=1 Tax=Nonomuraea sp. B19D2 TaxID=3159561 RepID=UPI0032DB171B